MPTDLKMSKLVLVGWQQISVLRTLAYMAFAL